MNNLRDPDPEFRDLEIDKIRITASRSGESVLHRADAEIRLPHRCFG
jgi:hypothetical protein